jgi:hypothetical protein
VAIHGSGNLLLRNKRPVSKPWEKGRVSERITEMSRLNLISFGSYIEKYNSGELKSLGEAHNDVCDTVK